MSCAAMMGHTNSSSLNRIGNGLISAKQQRFMTVAQYIRHNNNISVLGFCNCKVVYAHLIQGMEEMEVQPPAV